MIADPQETTNKSSMCRNGYNYQGCAIQNRLKEAKAKSKRTLELLLGLAVVVKYHVQCIPGPKVNVGVCFPIIRRPEQILFGETLFELDFWKLFLDF
jgi:hypothetical protein